MALFVLITMIIFARTTEPVLLSRAAFREAEPGVQTMAQTAVRTLIFTFDSREIADSSSSLSNLPSMTAALNHWYSRKVGATFAVYHAPSLDATASRASPVCQNSRLKVMRAAAWCKMLAVWSALTSPETQRFDYFVFIDSDAVFLRENISAVERHIAALQAPNAPPIGFLYHHPDNPMPSTGYFFFRRSQIIDAGTGRRNNDATLDAFFTQWWNFVLPENDLNFPWARILCRVSDD